MKICFQGISDELTNAIVQLSASMGFTIDDGEQSITGNQSIAEGKLITVDHCDCGFHCSVEGNTAKIAYHTKTDFFRALSLAVDALKNDSDLAISQAPAFKSCGIMLDVSRGAVVKVEKVKEIIRIISRMGFNNLMLYSEDIYEMKKYPYFGYMRGRYTADELKEIVAYAEDFGVEVVPCMQTLGHLGHPLRWAAFGNVKEADEVLLIGEDETYELIEEMIKTMRECFTTNRIHIGMDEAHGVGLGAYLLKHGYRDRFELLSEHLNKVLEICKKYDFEPMMWSDMFFRLGSKTNDYYDWDNQLPENIAELIPEGVTQVYWDYYNRSENLYQLMLAEHKKMNCPIIFAGGVWIWGVLSLNLVQTMEITIPALNTCLDQGIEEVVATLWGDDGSECDVFQSLYGLQLYAEYNYNGKNALNDLDKMFYICTGYDPELFKMLEINDFGPRNHAPEKCSFAEIEESNVNTSKQVLYANPLMGMFDKNLEGIDLKAHYGAIYEKLLSYDVPCGVQTMFACHQQLVKVLYLKCDISPRLKASYDARDKAALKAILCELSDLEKELGVLCDLRMKLWYENNKPFGHEPCMRNLAAAKELIHLCAVRLEGYVQGAVDRLEELEQERLYYNGIKRSHFFEYQAARIMMP